MNKNNHETLLHRIDTLFTLSEDFQKHAYLLPELLVKTIRDTHRFANNGISHLSSSEILKVLSIDSTDEENTFLNNIENSLRKSKDYQEFCDNYSKDILLSITKKIQTHLK